MSNKETKSNQKAAIDLLVEQLKNSSFATRYTIECKVVRDWSLLSKVKPERVISCYVRAQNPEESAELEKITGTINAKVQEDPTKYATLQDFQFIQSLKVGDKLPAYSNFQSVFKETPEEIKHQAGEVILIDVWATWCGPCQSPMQHNQEMLEKNAEKWGDKVKIIAVSVDDERQAVVKRITDRKWEKITHYKLNGWDGDHPLIKDFQIQGIPFVALVDTTGTLNFVGHPSEGNLEERISGLLEGKASSNAQAAELNSAQYKKLKSLVEKELPEQVASKSYSFEYNLNFVKTSLIQPESVKKTYQQPSFSSSYTKNEQAAYKEFKNNLSQSLGEGFPLKKESEKFKDVKSGIAIDLKELKKIFESQDLKAVETQQQVTTKLRLGEDGKLTQSKNEVFIQYSKLIAADEEAKKRVELANGKTRDYAISKFRSGEFADYLRKLFQQGITSVEDNSKLAAQPETDDKAYRSFKDVLESKKLLDLELKVDLPYDIKLSLVLRRHRVFDYQGQMKAKHHDKPVLKYQVRSDHQELVKTAVIDKLFTTLEQSTFVIQPKILNVVTIEVGKVCALCNAELSIPQYYNYFKKQHLCIQCGDKQDKTKKTIDQFAVPDNLVWLNSSQPYNIEEYKLGKNTQPKQDEEAGFKFNFSCSSCDNSGCTGRYICLCCRQGPIQRDGYIEFCTECKNQLVVEKDADTLQQVQLNAPTHTLEHALLNVRTSAGSYYDF